MHELRNIIVRAFQRGELQADICRRLKKDGVSHQFVSYTIKRWRETGLIADRPRCGGPRTARTPELIQKIRRKVRRNRRCSGRKLAKQFNMSLSTVQRVLKKDVGFKAYKRRKRHGLTVAQKRKRLDRCKELLRRFTDDSAKSIVFSDEKIFTTEEQFNVQNDRIYAASFHDIPEQMLAVQRFQAPSSIMVWAAVSTRGKFPLIFIKPGLKVDKDYYRREILEKLLEPHGRRIFKNQPWTFQEDSAPSHSAKVNQAWCGTHLPDFIRSSEWPPSSPDLNVLDYAIWGVLEAKVNATSHKSLESLKRALRREWKKLPMAVIWSAVNSWRGRLRACVKARGGRFE